MIKNFLNKFLIFALVITNFGVVFIIPQQNVVKTAEAAINKQINYQAKLTDTTNLAVADGTYNLEFALYTVSTGGTAVWTETRTGANKVQVTNGIFSVMLGEVTALTSVDFSQTLYLEVKVGGTGTPSWDTLTPRKIMGAVPAAFIANGVSGDGAVNTTNSSATALTVAKSGTNYALQVDTSAASAVTGLKVTSNASGSGTALTVISSAANENLTIDAKGSGTISIGSSSTGDILLGGGSGSTGCTLTNSTGALACTSTITGSNLSGTNTGDQIITLTGDVTGSGTGSFATTIASQNSSTWAGRVSDETGTGAWVFANTPTLVTPVLGVATATSINKVAITQPATSATLTIANTKTLTANNTLTFAGTDSTTITFQGTDTYVGRTTTDTLTNKTLTDASVLFADNTDATKKLAFELSGLTTATTRTLTVPDASGTIALTSNNLQL
jgi:hypothetical protein